MRGVLGVGVAGWSVGAVCVVALWGCGGASTGQSAVSEEARRLGVRAGLEAGLGRVEAALAAGDERAAGQELAAIWVLADGIVDDRVMRVALRQVPAEAVPRALARARALERAQEALEAGRPEVAGALLRALEGPPDGARDDRTALREGLVAALVAGEDGRATALVRLGRLANAGESSAGALARELGALARLTAAGLMLDGGDARGAIASFLRVEATSGHWRAARLGLATCQLEEGRPDAALKILALLPGGLAGEPERALLAAMAAHRLGWVDEAQAVVDAALAGRAEWEGGVEFERVLAEVARLLSGGGAPTEESLVTVVASSSPVRLAVGEVLATRAVRGRVAAGAGLEERWERRVTAAAEEVVAREVAAERSRAARRLADLEALRPQLR